MDHKNQQFFNENKIFESINIKLIESVDELEFRSIHKNLLIHLKQEFGHQFKQNKSSFLKRVAKLEKVGLNFNNNWIFKFIVIYN
jgi:hypothetical protein